MLLRLRVALPDRPGSLGQVARTLGVVGADIVSVVVLERVSGRAVDDFTVVWPASAPVDRVLIGLAAIPGVRVDGVWRGTELSEPSSGREVALIGQVAANPDHGLATVVDAAPALFGADWAVDPRIRIIGDYHRSIPTLGLRVEPLKNIRVDLYSVDFKKAGAGLSYTRRM